MKSTIDEKQDDAILLKIRRQFKTDEAVQAVLQILSKRDIEIGMLKSELAEAQDEITKLKNPPVTKTKKQWEQDDMFKLLADENKKIKEKNSQLNKDLTRWRNEAIQLKIKLDKYYICSQTPQI